MFCVNKALKSTSCSVKEVIQNGLAPSCPFAIFAYTQTQGRGTFGKNWVSPDGNLYFTFAFPSSLVCKNYDVLTLNNLVSIISALALKDLLSYFLPTKDVNIKWPNDIIVDNKKIAGILIEKVEDKQGKSYFSIGIGVNANTLPNVQSPKFLPTCIKDYIFKSVNVLELASLLDSLLLKYFNEFFEDSLKASALLVNYKESLMFLGKSIIFKSANEIHEGIFIDIDNQGLVILKEHESGALKRFSSGEILYYGS